MKKALRIIEGVFVVLEFILSTTIGIAAWVLIKTNNLEAILAVANKVAKTTAK